MAIHHPRGQPSDAGFDAAKVKQDMLSVVTELSTQGPGFFQCADRPAADHGESRCADHTIE